MDLETQTSQKLHDEHMSVKAFLEKFAAELARFKPGQLPDASATVLNAMLADLIAIVEVELSVHFRFEEEWLFPLLQTGGAQDMGDLLSEEHDVILPLAYQLCAHARTFRHEGYSAAAWDEFRRGGMELAERLTAHIDKEEMGLVPMLDTLLDKDKDDELAVLYAGMR